MANFSKEFLRRLVQGKSINESFKGAAEATTDDKGNQPFWDPTNKKPIGLNLATAAGIDPDKGLNPCTGAH